MHNCCFSSRHVSGLFGGLPPPFGENAFKCLSSYPDPAQNRLTIYLSVSGRTAGFQIKNARQSRPPRGQPGRGPGTANVQKRLHLLYPGKHQLRITEEVHWYQVQFRIGLT